MSDKPTTPVASPKSARLSSPPDLRGGTAPKRHSAQRLSASFLKTPEQRRLREPEASPSLKRANSSAQHYKLPDPRNSHSVLKTPRYLSPRYLGANTSDDEDSTTANGSPIHRQKLQKTPQFFLSAKTLFQEGSGSNDDLAEISSQLKNRLSSAFGKLKEDPHSPGAKLSFTELSFDTAHSPTRSARSRRRSSAHSRADATPWTPSHSLQTLNLNLQTLQQSPLPQAKSATMFPASPTNTLHFQTCFKQEDDDDMMSTLEYRPGPLQRSPFENSRPQYIHVPGADESLAQSALLAALSRQKRVRRGKENGDRKENRHSVEWSLRADKRNMYRFSGDWEQRDKRHSVEWERHNKRHSAEWEWRGSGKREAVPNRRSIDLGSDNQNNHTSTPNSNFNDLRAQKRMGRYGAPQLPPLSVALESKGDHEQDAVLSLMSLSSPRAMGRLHSRTQSWESRASLSPLASPIQGAQVPGVGDSRVAPASVAGGDAKVALAAAALVSPVRLLVDNDETDVDDVSDATVEE